MTFRSASVTDENSWKDYTVPVSAFVAGMNTIAVEIHQTSGNSSDIRLDMLLRGEVTAGGATNVSNPIFFAQPTMVKARAFNSSSGEWSPLNEAFFSIDTRPRRCEQPGGLRIQLPAVGTDHAGRDGDFDRSRRL